MNKNNNNCGASLIEKSDTETLKAGKPEKTPGPVNQGERVLPGKKLSRKNRFYIFMTILLVFCLAFSSTLYSCGEDVTGGNSDIDLLLTLFWVLAYSGRAVQPTEREKEERMQEEVEAVFDALNAEIEIQQEVDEVFDESDGELSGIEQEDTGYYETDTPTIDTTQTTEASQSTQPQDTQTTTAQEPEEDVSTYQAEVTGENSNMNITIDLNESTGEITGEMGGGVDASDGYRTSILSFNSELKSDNSFSAIATGDLYIDGEYYDKNADVSISGKLSADGSSIDGELGLIDWPQTPFSAEKVASLKDTAHSDLPTGIWQYQGLVYFINTADIYLTVNYDICTVSGYFDYIESTTGSTVTYSFEGTLNPETGEMNMSGLNPNGYEVLYRGKVLKMGLRIEGSVGDKLRYNWYADAVNR